MSAMWPMGLLFVSLPYRCYIPNLVRIGPVVSEEKMLTHDGRRTSHDDGRQPIAIGHLSDSGDLKSSDQAKGSYSEAAFVAHYQRPWMSTSPLAKGFWSATLPKFIFRECSGPTSLACEDEEFSMLWTSTLNSYSWCVH